MKAVLCSVLALLSGCDSVFSPFTQDNPQNCVQVPGTCTAGMFCNRRSEACEPVPPRANQVAFTTRLMDVGQGPRALILCDLDGNGDLDLAVTLEGDRLLRTYLGNGQGGFTAAGQEAVGAEPYSLAQGDLNADGKADVVVANQGIRSLTVLLGDGHGGFSQSSPYSSASKPVGVLYGGFREAKSRDVVFGASEANYISIATADAKGMLGKDVQILVNAPPSALAAGDFTGDGDGRTDLVVATTLGLNVLLKGQTTGFTLLGPLTLTGAAAVSLATGDFNGDGKLDLALTDGNGALAVLLGDGRGGLDPHMLPIAHRPVQVAVADIDGDQKLDLVLAGGMDNNVMVLLGDGKGGFGEAMSFAADVNTTGLMVGDLDGDGRPDVVTANNGAGTIAVLLNRSH